MQKRQIILASIALILILLAFVCFIFRKELESITHPTETEVLKNPVEEIKNDSLPYKEILKKALNVREVKKIKNQNKKEQYQEIWKLSNGTSIIKYLLLAKNHIELYEGQVLDMQLITYKKDTKPNSLKEEALLHFVDFNSDTTRVKLQVATYLYDEGSSKMAIVFEADKQDYQNYFELLHNLDYPFTLLLTPWEFYPDSAIIAKKDPAFHKRLKTKQNGIAMLRNDSNCSFIIWPYMEDDSLNQTHTNPIRMSDKEKTIQERIENGFKLIPSAIGVATRYGRKAVENKKFIKNILLPLKDSAYVFLDLTKNKRSEVQKVCKELNVICNEFDEYDRNHSKMKEYINRKKRDAEKNGFSVMIIPISGVKDLLDLKKTLSEQGTKIVHLKELMGNP